MRGAGVGCGVLLPSFDPARPAGPPPVVRAARLAEELGFESLWVGDHLGHAASGLDAPACMAASAAVTERIALGSSAMALGQRNPAWTAKQLISIDLLAGGGRLRLGVGVGGPPPTDGRVTVSEDDARLDDALAVIGDLLTGQAVDYDGHALSVHAPALAPTLPSAPPVYISGHDEPALRRAARFGDVWMPMWLGPPQLAERSQLLEEMAREQGRPMPGLAAAIGVRIDDDRDHACAAARAQRARGFGVGPGAVEPETVLDSIDGAVERLHRFVEVGVSELVLIALGEDPLQQYERLAEVRARLHSAAAASGTAT
jgi:alkanesulfonate monooxygenase SsuD/methylene tetrahydromethanopterin reductase-like flavin-dependent oxidoreductase (luciferase family)